MLTLFDVETGDDIGTLSADQLDELVAHFQVVSDVGDACWVNLDTLEELDEDGGDPELITMLRKAMKGRDEMEIRWEKS